MKPGKGLRRTGFTNRGKPLRRYVGLDRSSKSRAGSGATGEGGSVVSSAGRPRATRRIARGMGGRHGAAKKQSDRPSDLLDSCLYCHLLITRYGWRVDAKGNGWVLVDGQDPTAEPVLYRGDLVYLDDAGNKISHEKAGA
jgi:hypothetical protein